MYRRCRPNNLSRLALRFGGLAGHQGRPEFEGDDAWHGENLLGSDRGKRQRVSMALSGFAVELKPVAGLDEGTGLHL